MYTCEFCKLSYPIRYRKSQKFCSKSCYKQTHTIKYSIQAKFKRVKPSSRICAHCPKIFTPRNNYALYCSKRCQQLAWETRRKPSKHNKDCLNCGKKFVVTKPQRLYCSAYCKNRTVRKRHEAYYNLYAAKRRFRVAIVSFKITEKDLNRLFHRQMGHCYICGVYLDNPHLDHIHPIAKGGKHSIGNLAYACRSCNSSKNDKWLMEVRRESGCYIMS